jgi:hypothetical protein
MNTDELADFVQLMISDHPDYKNRIIDLYRKCVDNIINSIIDNSIIDKKSEIESCVNSIKELVNAQ